MGLLSVISSRKEQHVVVEKIELEKIIPDPQQPRKSFTGLEELAETIKTHGIQNPIHVRKENEQYIIITGERRWRACREHTTLKTIPCFVHGAEDQQTIRCLQLIENLQRADLQPLEEATSYQSLLDSGEITQKELASAVGVSETEISRTLKLLHLVEAIQQELANYPEIAKSLLMEIAQEKDPERQKEFWEKVKTGQIEKRAELRRERQGLKKKDLAQMDAEEIWEVIKKAVRTDKEILKKLINAAQFERLLRQEREGTPLQE